jgi:hypothetical protein
MTTTPLRPIKYRHNGGIPTPVAAFDLAVPSEAEALLPEPIRQARAVVLELAQADNEAQGDIFRTHQAIEPAETQDAAALGGAILAGEPDPGPVNVSAARTAHAEAQRRAAGIAQALNTARQTYFEVVSSTDRTEAVAAIEALAVTELAKAEDALVTLQAAYGTYRGLRSFAGALALAPSRPEPFLDDSSTVGHAMRNIREQLAMIRPVYDEPKVRAVAPSEGRFTDNAYSPPPGPEAYGVRPGAA